MRSRNIQCVHLHDVFRDFERANLSMSWVYGNIGPILKEAGVTVYASVHDIHEKVDVYRLRREFENEDANEVGYRVSLLGSGLIKNLIPDRKKICDFLLGKLDSYDDIENLHVVYDFKELIEDIKIPLSIPSQLATFISVNEWKSSSLQRDCVGADASVFARENQIHRLHQCTTLCVRLGDFAIERQCVANLLALVSSLPEAAIGTYRAKNAAEKSRGGRPPKAWWDDFWIEFWGRLYDGEIKPMSHDDVKKAMRNLLIERGWLLDDKELRVPACKAWARIKPEVDRIHVREY